MHDPARVAARTWRRLGVRAEVARAMARDLEADIADAVAAGRSPESFTGGDPAALVRSWAAERGVVRARPRLVRIVAAAIAGAVPGAALALLLVVAPSSLFVNDLLLRGTGRSAVVSPVGGVQFNYAYSMPLWVVLLGYLVSLAVAVGGSLAAVSTALSLVGDPARRHTLRAWALAQPVVAVLGLLAGVVTAALNHFDTRASVALQVGLAVLALVALSAGVVRVLVLRRERSAPAPA